MEQPPGLAGTNPQKSKETKKKKFPSPQELISHYETQGLDSQQASLKVIEDLQNVLLRVVSSKNSAQAKKDKLLVDASKKIDSVNSRLVVVDMKVDSKPGYVESFGIGIASGAALKGISSFLPHVLQGFGQIWCAVRNATNPSSSTSSP